jgi:hypothetical protein
MDKYALLIILNTPVVIYGVAKAFGSYKKGRIKKVGLGLRLAFWGLILAGLVFAEELYNFLVVRGLTDSSPLSIADVVVVTGLSFCLFLILRLYSKLDTSERRFTELHERLSIELSKRKKDGK